MSALVAAKKSRYRRTPDMRLTRRAGEDEPVRDGITLADRMLFERSECLRDETRTTAT